MSWALGDLDSYQRVSAAPFWHPESRVHPGLPNSSSSSERCLGVGGPSSVD